MAQVSTIPTVGIRGRTAALALSATFVVGMAVGMAVSGVALPNVGSGGGAALNPVWSSTEAMQAWLDYRAGERAALGVGGGSSGLVTQAWLDYRAGERADLTATAWTAAESERAWLDYRAGERGDLSAP
jgi:hypothetical protein